MEDLMASEEEELLIHVKILIDVQANICKQIDIKSSMKCY